MQDMKKEDIAGDGQCHDLSYYDSDTRTVWIVDQEVPFPNGRLIVSCTNPEGTITQVNQSFVEMSGYTHDELMGVPHAILRHPDMPAAAFKGLWDTVQKGETWQGYVKNLRKDGCYYWVKATVIPNIRNGTLVGYTSVRRKPSRKKIEECTALYAQMRQSESNAT